MLKYINDVVLEPAHVFGKDEAHVAKWVLFIEDYTIFDLLTNENQDYIYGSLYSNSPSANKYKLDVYGTNGFVIFDEKFNWKTYRTYKKASEISFGIDRYVSAVNNTENSWFTKAELIERAESLQFEKLPQDTVETVPSI